MDQSFNTFSYIVKAFLRSFFSFFSDWYLVAPVIYWQKVLWFFHDLDKSVALKEMARHWLSPLYQDYNLAGYLIGILIRTGWIIFGLFFYALFFIIAALLFFIWLLIIPGLIFIILFAPLLLNL